MNQFGAFSRVGLISKDPIDLEIYAQVDWTLELHSSQLERNATQDILPKGVLYSIDGQCGQMIQATYLLLEIMTTCDDCSLFSDCPNVEQPMGSYFFRTIGKG